MQSHDVALSFAGEDRAYVDMVARFLKEHDVSLFYDEYSDVDMWGKDLYGHLAKVYSEAGRFVVMFISAHYALKVWTNHERRAAQSRALSERTEYILPVRFDDTAIEGLLPTVHFLDARRISPEVLATKILAKLGRPIVLAKANKVPAPHSPSLNGEVAFDYTSHDGRFDLGTGELTFGTHWTPCSNRTIYCYNDGATTRGVAVVPRGSKIESLNDVSQLDFSSRWRCPEVGQFVVIQNTRGFFALLRIEGISDSSNGGKTDELRIRYWIRADGGVDFSNEKS